MGFHSCCMLFELRGRYKRICVANTEIHLTVNWSVTLTNVSLYLHSFLIFSYLIVIVYSNHYVFSFIHRVQCYNKTYAFCWNKPSYIFFLANNVGLRLTVKLQLIRCHKVTRIQQKIAMFNVSIYVHHLRLEVTQIIVTMLNSVKKKKKKKLCVFRSCLLLTTKARIYH